MKCLMGSSIGCRAASLVCPMEELIGLSEVFLFAAMGLMGVKARVMFFSRWFDSCTGHPDLPRDSWLCFAIAYSWMVFD